MTHARRSGLKARRVLTLVAARPSWKPLALRPTHRRTGPFGSSATTNAATKCSRQGRVSQGHRGESTRVGLLRAEVPAAEAGRVGRQVLAWQGPRHLGTKGINRVSEGSGAHRSPGPKSRSALPAGPVGVVGATVNGRVRYWNCRKYLSGGPVIRRSSCLQGFSGVEECRSCPVADSARSCPSRWTLAAI